MLIRVIMAVIILIPVIAHSKTIGTAGDCSPIVAENGGNVRINCYINGLPLDSIVRSGNAIELLDALNSGLSAEVLLQGFVLGFPDRLSGVSFFENVEIKDFEKLLDKLAENININNKIRLNEDSYTTLFWLASKAQRKDVIMLLTQIGASIHGVDHRYGGAHDEFLTKSLFPIVHLIDNGTISLDDSDVINELYANSFVIPDRSKEKNTLRGMKIIVNANNNKDFDQLLEKRNQIISNSCKGPQRKELDFLNIKKLCKLASKSDNFDWYNRLEKVSLSYTIFNEDKNGIHYASNILLIGLMNITSEYAIFLMAHDRAWGDLGEFYVPKKGNVFFLKFWDDKGCWDDRLDGWERSCWREYYFIQDPFNPNMFKGKRWYPRYLGNKTKLSDVINAK